MYNLITTVLLLQVFSYGWTLDEEIPAANQSIANCAAVEQSGVYKVSLPDTNEIFSVFCDQETNNGGWTLVLHRFKGKLDFHNRDWKEYRNGFGGFDREYFIGLEKLSLLTTSRTHSLLILMEDFDDIDYSTLVLEFEIDNEENNYEFSQGKSSQGTEIGLPNFGTRFCAADVFICWKQLIGWQWSGRNSKVTKNRLNLFGPYLKVGDNIRPDTMGFYNEETEKVHPLRSIKMLIRPVNIFRNSYGETLSEFY